MFLTLLCLLMLKMNLAGEWLGLSFYDNAIVTSNAAAAVLPIGLASALAIHRLACEFVDSRSDPLTKGDIVRVIACPEQIQCCGRLGKVTESDETDGLLVEVRIRNAEAPCLYAACRRSLDDVFQLRLQRAQVQIILGKKQTLKLVMGVVKQIFACAKAVRVRGLCAHARPVPHPQRHRCFLCRTHTAHQVLGNNGAYRSSCNFNSTLRRLGPTR